MSGNEEAGRDARTNTVTLEARVSRLETALVILVCVVGALTVLYVPGRPRAFHEVREGIALVTASLVGAVALWHFFRRGVLFAVGANGFFVRGRTNGWVPWCYVQSVEEMVDGDRVTSITFRLNESAHQSLVPSRLTGRVKREITLNGIGYDVSGNDIRDAIHRYIGDTGVSASADKSMVYWGITYAVVEPQSILTYPLIFLFRNTVERTLNLIGVRGSFLRAAAGLAVTVAFFYALILSLYVVKTLADGSP